MHPHNPTLSVVPTNLTHCLQDLTHRETSMATHRARHVRTGMTYVGSAAARDGAQRNGVSARDGTGGSAYDSV